MPIPRIEANIVEAPTVEDITPSFPLILEKIGHCESGNRQFYTDGSVVKGRVNNLDIGKYQINLKYWSVQAEELGYDLYTEEGNTLMALYIYNNYGVDPWVWSKPCWGK